MGLPLITTVNASPTVSSCTLLMYKFVPQAHPRKGESTKTIFAFKGWILDIFFCGFSNVETKTERDRSSVVQEI